MSLLMVVIDGGDDYCGDGGDDNGGDGGGW